jgi:hypothetical protein
MDPKTRITVLCIASESLFRKPTKNLSTTKKYPKVYLVSKVKNKRKLVERKKAI